MVRCLFRLLVATAFGACSLWTFVSPASAAPEATASVRGFALWDFNENAVPFATVTLTREGEAPRSDITGRRGEFVMSNVTTGTWQLRVTTPCGVHAPVDVVVPDDPIVTQVVRRHDAFGYRCLTSTQSQPQLGTPVALTGDEATTSVPLPFPFPFYGQEASAVTVSTNGWISAASAPPTPANTALPAAAQPNLAVYAFWDDLLVDSSASVRTSLTGDTGARQFEVQWLDVAVKSDPTQRLNAYVRLSEINDSISVSHHAVAGGADEEGAGATIGIEGPAGTTALQASHNERTVVSGRMLIFIPEPTAPLADAGPDRSVPSQADFSLDATDSTDGEGGPLTVSWIQTTGPTTALDDPTSTRPRATAPLGPATLRYRVTVRDLSGLTGTDDVVVTVAAPPSK
jgi:hypothetical protein